MSIIEFSSPEDADVADIEMSLDNRYSLANATVANSALLASEDEEMSNDIRTSDILTSDLVDLEWALLEEDIQELKRSYGKPATLAKITAVQILKNALHDVETAIREVQTKVVRLYRGASADQRSEMRERRPILLATLQELKNNLLSEIEQRTGNGSSISTAAAQPLLPPLPPLPLSLPSNIKLPKLEIHQFSGKITEWLDFKSIFTSSIHNALIPEGQKFRYLRSLLSGEPLHYIQHLPTTDGNYERAWSILTAHYDNPLLLVQHHVEQLFSCPHVKPDGGKGLSLRELYATFKQHLAGIRTVERENENLDPSATAYIFLFLMKCPPALRSDFRREIRRNGNVAMTEVDFFDYIQGWVHSELEPQAKKSLCLINTTNARSITADEKKKYCLFCKRTTDHFMNSCVNFRALPVEKRIEAAKSARVCFLCLRKKCNRRCFRSKCEICQRRHHTLLHDETRAHKRNNGKFHCYIEILKALNLTSDDHSQSLLATARVKILNNSNVIEVKALLDSGSQKNFMSHRVRKLAFLPVLSNMCVLQGIDNLTSKSLYGTRAQIASCISSSYVRSLDFLVLDKIVDSLPATFFPIDFWNIPDEIELADPTFNIPSEVDILLGSDIFWDILQNQKLKIRSLPQFRKTSLGWIVAGQLKVSKVSNNSTCQSFSHRVCVSTVPYCDLPTVLEKFWIVEDNPSLTSALTPEQEAAEQFFIQTTTKDSTGRFTVRLPWKRSPTELGDSRQRALKRFLCLEKKLLQNNSLRERYSKCINEYLPLNHMRKVEEVPGENSFYVPHHAVIKETSTSTKLRVVFDASAKTTTGHSLNDLLMVGPVVQSELVSILIRFRMKKYVLSADITKMYRQIRVHEDDTRYLRILWRNSPQEDLSVYESLRIMFGIASAPFLATRCIKQLGLDSQNQYPLTSFALLHDFYVDDVLTGADTIEEARDIQNQLISILAGAGFPLTKWCANDDRLLKNVSFDDQEHEFPFSFDGEPTIKTLGILWRPGEDMLRIRYQELSHATTKREILSAIAAIYDPLGLCGPVTSAAKILMQNIWKSINASDDSPLAKTKASKEASWDEPLPNDLISQWNTLAGQLHTLKDIALPRCYFTFLPTVIELHGFCDASERAYGAVVYIRGLLPGCTSCANIVISKSRVAPLKKQSLPRLELCGALLLAELAFKVKEILELQYNISLVRLWCDSMIALSWIHLPSHKLETFIANRVQKIQNYSQNFIWDHIDSSLNPADFISRGLAPEELLKCKTWWSGPVWLTNNTTAWTHDSSFSAIQDLQVGLKPINIANVHLLLQRNSIFDKYSSFSKLIRVMAFICRFLRIKFNLPKYSGPLHVHELNTAKTVLIKLSQEEYFFTEIMAIQNCIPGQNVVLPKDSPLRHLSLFLDDNNILRITGRLDEAAISFDQKNPAVLHPEHPFTLLLIQFEHLNHLHAGPRLLKSVLRRNYFILRSHNAINKCIKQCIICVKKKATTMQQYMSTLPKNRVVPSRPFTISGVDYAGPIMIKCHGGKRPIIFKAYIALFVCFSTKAVHLELIPDLSSLAFLNALSRFISRRGKVLEIHSDNGTTFKGAKSLLDKQFQLFLKENQFKIIDFASARDIVWRFIPVYTPHWGGLWEANIKAMKGHLKSVLKGANILNFDDAHTLLTHIEAILNSRPLTPESSDPSDLSALTPGHFLIGGPLTALPNTNLISGTPNRIKQWKLMQKLTLHFWKRWSSDYLNTLHQRTKWKIQKNDLKVNDFVLIKEKDLPPTHWSMGRVIKVHLGRDNKVRLADIQTKAGIVTRSLSNLAYLPINND